MKFLLLEKELQPGKPIPAELLKEEAAYLWKWTQADVVREIYFHADAHTAVLLLEWENRSALEEWIAGLPLVREGWIRFEVLPLQPYDGFARLFEGE